MNRRTISTVAITLATVLAGTYTETASAHGLSRAQARDIVKKRFAKYHAFVGHKGVLGLEGLQALRVQQDLAGQQGLQGRTVRRGRQVLQGRPAPRVQPARVGRNCYSHTSSGMEQ